MNRAKWIERKVMRVQLYMQKNKLDIHGIVEQIRNKTCTLSASDRDMVEQVFMKENVAKEASNGS